MILDFLVLLQFLSQVVHHLRLATLIKWSGRCALPHLPSSLGSIPYSPLNRVSSTPGIRQPVQVSPGVDDCHQQRVSPEIELAAAHQRGLRPTWVAGHYGADVISYFLQQWWPSNNHDLSRPIIFSGSDLYRVQFRFRLVWHIVGFSLWQFFERWLTWWSLLSW